MSRRVRVFVYGTLMRGQANHRVLVELDAFCISRASTIDSRTLVDLGPYPALLPTNAARDADQGVVEGELYDLPEASLARLDAFEGCPDLYTRERIALARDGAPVEAWTYVLARPLPGHAVVLATGRYKGGGVALERDARERETEAAPPDILDKSPKISDVSPPSEGTLPG